MNHLEEIPNELMVLISPDALRRFLYRGQWVRSSHITRAPQKPEEFIERLSTLKKTLETSPQQALSTLEKAHQLRQSILKED